MALFSASKQTHSTLVASDFERVTVALHSVLRVSTMSGVDYLQRYFWLLHATWNCCPLGAHFVYTIHLTLVYSVIQSQIGRLHVCLAVTCHVHFWQNGQDLLCAAVITWGSNRYIRQLVSVSHKPFLHETKQYAYCHTELNIFSSSSSTSSLPTPWHGSSCSKWKSWGTK